MTGIISFKKQTTNLRHLSISYTETDLINLVHAREVPCGQLYRHDRTDHKVHVLGVRSSYVLFWSQTWNKHNTHNGSDNKKRINNNRTAPLKIHFFLFQILAFGSVLALYFFLRPMFLKLVSLHSLSHGYRVTVNVM